MIKHKLCVEEFDVDKAELVDAVGLAQNGKKTLAREIALTLKDAIKNGHSVVAMDTLVGLLDDLKLHSLALEVALQERQLIIKTLRTCKEWGQVGTEAQACIDWLANNGHETEASSIEKALEELNQEAKRKP